MLFPDRIRREEERSMKRLISIAALLLTVFAVSAMAQTEDAYAETDEEKSTKGGLLDPSKFSIRHAATFGMSSSSNTSGLQSQSLYMTMLQYQFSKPVTVNLNFGLPIHSTYNEANNLTQRNLESAEYFRNMPFNASITWQPTNNFLMRLTVARDSYPTSYLMGQPMLYRQPSLIDEDKDK